MNRLRKLEKLYLNGNPNLNHLPDFLWDIKSLKELKIDGKLIKYLPENVKISLDNNDLKDGITDLIIASKYNKKMSDQDLDNMTGTYIVYLK